MPTNDTPATLATTASATAFAYLLALRRATLELVNVDELQPDTTTTIRTPHWFDAGAPWQLTRTGGRLPWRAVRADRLPAPGADTPAALALAFDDTQLAAAAVRMVQFDRANPYVLQPAMWEVAANV